jgi:hypothetical protein
MKTRDIVLVAVFAIIAMALFTLMFFYILEKTTNPQNNYSYTRAMCNATNYCQDYEVNCSNGDILNIKPISQASVQHSLSWKDPRETPQDLCK